MNATSSVRHRSRWLRFSLRTLLVVMTALCIWLGLQTAAARRQHAAVEAILAAGGKVDYDYQKVTIGGMTGIDPNQSMPGPNWLRRMIGDDFFVSPIDVFLDGDQVTDELIEKHVAALTHLEDLRVNSRNLSGRGLQSIAGLNHLEWIWVVSPQISVNDLVALKRLKSLKSLHIYHDIKCERLAEPKTSIEFIEVPMSEVVKYLIDRHHFPVVRQSNQTLFLGRVL